MTTSGQRVSFLGSGWIYWPLCLIACALVALAVLGPEAERRLDLERQCARMGAEVQSLAQARDQLEAAREALQQDPTYVEQVARHELGAVRPGEIRLPQPDEFASVRFQPPADPTPPAPPVLGFLASFADPQVRLMALVVGGMLLAVAVLFSIPTSPPRPARA
ncbi:MAG: septum formation initiator family protein [Planctomycetota bacterium]|nr:septum formation initiator family protein [Planctomycetota bacterium]